MECNCLIIDKTPAPEHNPKCPSWREDRLEPEKPKEPDKERYGKEYLPDLPGINCPGNGPSVNIGRYEIHNTFDSVTGHKIWIGVNGQDPKWQGEGGGFDEDEVFKLIDKFYRENF